jgi:cytosine/adenosine deaminase-related metal-dependent hydrolase
MYFAHKLAHNKEALPVSLIYEKAVWANRGQIYEGQLWLDPRRGRMAEARSTPSHQTRWVDASQWYLYPALINAHEHLEFNHYPRTRYRDRYENASQWAADMQAHLDEEPFLSLRARPLWERCWIGGFKNLMSGVGQVLHHNPPHPQLFAADFPVKVFRPYTWAHSLYLTPPPAIQQASRGSRWRIRRPLFCIHLAEGTDEAAAQEIYQLQSLGALGPKTLLIHGVGLDEAGRRLAIQAGAALAWCPSSNDFLLGETAQVGEFFRAGRLLLGSDSRLTAAGDLFDEIRAAVAGGQLTIRQVFRLATDMAAKLFGREGGALDPGQPAHLFALPRHLGPDPYAALLAARPEDMVWIRRGGVLILQQAAEEPNLWLRGRPYRLSEPLWKMGRQISLWPHEQISFL